MSGRFAWRPSALPALAAAAALLAGPLLAETPFSYAGKTMIMLIGFGPGGGYDLWARVVARHIGKHLPGNPTVTPQNLEGAGSYRTASHIYNIAPKDGTTIGLISRDAVLGPLTGSVGAQFDATKFTWLGTPAIETNVCFADRGAGVKTAADLTQKELIVGDNGPGTGTHSYPKALNDILGMKFKLIGGYPSSAAVFLAIERGEVSGLCESIDSIKVRKPEWIPSHRIALLFQGGVRPDPDPDLKDVPFVVDLAKKPEDKQAIEFLYVGQGIGRPFVAPPGLPPDRIAMLRDAFAATMTDPDFLAEAERLKLTVRPESGAYLEDLIKKTYATPRTIIDRIAKLIQ
jgi:tripartite-type tricarboxylate transporter receptor subunit TctC